MKTNLISEPISYLRGGLRSRFSHRLFACVGTATFVLAAPATHAQTFISTFGTTAPANSWNINSNWTTPSVFPNAVGASATFNSPTATQTVSLLAAITVGSISLTNNGSSVLTLANGTAGSLAFSVSSGNAAFNISGTGTAVNVLSASSALTSTLDFTISDTAVITSTGALQISGTLTGAGGVIKDGAGTMSFSNVAKAYTGSTVINAGILRTSTAGIANATSGVTVNSGGTLSLNGSGTSPVFQFGNASTVVTLNGIGTTSFLGTTTSGGVGALQTTGVGMTLSNNVALASDSTISTGVSLTLSGTVTGSGALTKSGTSVLTLSGLNTYSGGTVVTAGTVTANGASGLGATTGALTVGNASTAATAVIVNLSTTSATTTGSLSGSITAPATGTNTATINNGGQLFTVNQTTGKTYAGVITGGGGLTLGSGSTNTLTLTGANTFTGATAVSAGTLVAGAADALKATSAITVNNGGTLLLSGTGDRINNSAGLTLAGGTLNTGGLSEGVVTNGQSPTAGLGALTLSANSAIDFGVGANGSALIFTSLAATSGTVSIFNWTGTAGSDDGSVTNDRLLFTSGVSFTDAQLSQIQFYSDSNGLFATGATAISFGSYSELVPVPEPTTIFAALALVSLVGYRERRRLLAFSKAGVVAASPTALLSCP